MSLNTDSADHIGMDFYHTISPSSYGLRMLLFFLCNISPTLERTLYIHYRSSPCLLLYLGGDLSSHLSSQTFGLAYQDGLLRKA